MTDLAVQSMPTIPDEAAERAIAMQGVRRVQRTGLMIAGVFVFGGLLWSALAPLSLAVMAPGVVVVEGSRRAVQHLEGGIVAEIGVRNGDTVQAGQSVLRLAPAQSDATMGVLMGQMDGERALIARLVAERDGQAELAFDETLLSRKGVPSAEQAMAGQTEVFRARREYTQGRIAIIEARRAQSGKAISGLEAQRKSLVEQQSLIAKELADVEALYKKGLERRPRLLALQREAADLDGRIGQIDQEMARINLEISQLDLQIEDVRSTYTNEAVAELREAQKRLLDLASRLDAATDVADRLDVVAPITGTVVGLSVHAIGEVVRPGETMLEVVPSEDGLVIAAQIRPEDAEDLVPGQPVEVYLTAYHQRRLPVIDGEVTYISADRITDERTGVGYYEARIKVAKDALKGIENVSLKAGMPAEVAIQTGEMTVLESILLPITSVLDRGLREP